MVEPLTKRKVYCTKTINRSSAKSISIGSVPRIPSVQKHPAACRYNHECLCAPRRYRRPRTLASASLSAGLAFAYRGLAVTGLIRASGCTGRGVPRAGQRPGRKAELASASSEGGTRRRPDVDRGPAGARSAGAGPGKPRLCLAQLGPLGLPPPSRGAPEAPPDSAKGDAGVRVARPRARGPLRARRLRVRYLVRQSLSPSLHPPLSRGSVPTDSPVSTPPPALRHQPLNGPNRQACFQLLLHLSPAPP